jgi:arylsulfatase A-like enzyme
MKRVFALFVLLLPAPLATATLATAAEVASTPNIVVILSDDFGWGSVGCYGAPAELKTPNLDRLAREGRRFTQAYAPGSVCSPTRYGLMTGRYYWRTSAKDGRVLPGNAPLHIETNRVTLASLCKNQGYRTAAFGKWHLGLGEEARRLDWSGVLKPGPREIGFDYFFGLAANPWSGPHSFLENDEVLGKISGEPIVVSGNREGATTSGIKTPWQENEIMKTLTEQVVSWLEQQEPGHPFFVYYAPNAVHRPIAPNPRFSGSKFGHYGDFIHELDWSVGEILAALERGKLAENTLVIFTSDNGGVSNERLEDEIFAARENGLLVNGPLRGGKHDVWEGGFREPFLVRWPGKTPAGTVSDQVICLTDVLATFAGILDVPLPPGAAEDSFDVGRALTENTPGPPVRDHVILQAADGTYAIRMGDWKLVERVGAPLLAPRNKKKAPSAARKSKPAPREDELFNLPSDPAEANNVLAANAERVARMKEFLREVRERGYSRPTARN